MIWMLDGFPNDAILTTIRCSIFFAIILQMA
jgi:hypothetical protein